MILISNVNSVYAGPGSRAVWGEGLGRLLAEVAGWNPASDMDVCPLSLHVLLSQAQALRRADHFSKESCNVCVRDKWVMEKAWSLTETGVTLKNKLPKNILFFFFLCIVFTATLTSSIDSARMGRLKRRHCAHPTVSAGLHSRLPATC